LRVSGKLPANYETVSLEVHVGGFCVGKESHKILLWFIFDPVFSVSKHRHSRNTTKGEIVEILVVKMQWEGVFYMIHEFV
jgi:hypothetical protein